MMQTNFIKAVKWNLIKLVQLGKQQLFRRAKWLAINIMHSCVKVLVVKGIFIAEFSANYKILLIFARNIFYDLLVYRYIDLYTVVKIINAHVPYI